jgi:hypothetical protein
MTWKVIQIKCHVLFTFYKIHIGRHASRTQLLHDEIRIFQKEADMHPEHNFYMMK